MEVKMFKRVVLVVLAIALLLPVGLAGVWLWGQATSPAAAQTDESAAEHSPAETITVVGRGSVRVMPDVAMVSVGVETSAETVGEAVAQNEDLMTAILAALKEVGIAEEDVQTMNYSIQLDRYPEPTPRAEPTAAETKPVYRVSNMVNVTVRDLESVGNVLDAVIEAGANNIWGISFAVDDPTTAEGDARAKAMEDAQARAASLAELSGVKLGPVMSVSEVVGATQIAVPVAMERAAAGAGPISPGMQEVSYQIQVTYFIER
jgi:uncharacterized protein YggE